jgi:hypothetical protein
VIAAAVAGALLLALAVYDVFVTVLLHWGKSGPVSRAVTHLCWRLGLAMARRLPPSGKRRVLGMVGPLLIPLIVGVWAAMTILGFGFLYLPWMPDGFDRWERALPAAGLVSDAVYVSGYTFFTLGFGDIVPVAGVPRALIVLQAGGGFALITFVISYFVSVYHAYRDKTALAESFHHRCGGGSDAVELIARSLPHPDPAASLAGELGELREGLVRLRADYSNYPILHFFRDPRPEQSSLRLLFLASDLALLLDEIPAGDDAAGLRGLGTRTGLRSAVERAERDLYAGVVRQLPEEAGGDDLPPALESSFRERFVDARERLGSAGMAVSDDPAAPARYARQRRGWNHRLKVSAEALGETWDEVAGES